MKQDNGISTSSSKLLIYGHGADANAFISAARRYGFIPVAIYHKRIKSFFSYFTSDKVVLKSKFKKIANTSEIPIVITNLSSDYSMFGKDIEYIRNKLQLKNPILHPVFLCDYYKSIHKRYHLRGFPGSGNMVFQNIMDAILKSDNFFINRSPPDPIHPLMEKYALLYWHSLTYHYEHLLDAKEVLGTTTAPRYMRTASFAISLKNKEELVPLLDGLPCRSYIWANPWGADHSPLTAESIDFFQSQNFFNIHILRHPLDVLISNANKVVRTSQYSPKNIINNEIWFTEMLNQIVKYYALIIENKHRVYIVKYEDYIDDPITTIQHFSTALGATLPKTTCVEIWESIHGKEFSSFWKPGKNKWKTYITDKYINTIKKSGIIEIAEKLGYEINIYDLQREECDTNNMLDLYSVTIRDALDHRCNIGKKITFKHPEIITQNIEDTNIHITCFKSDFDKFDTFLKSALNKELLKAASFKPYIQSLDAYHYFHKS